MSAICGIHYYDGRAVGLETGAVMLQELGIYKADAVGSWCEGNLFFGCQTQNITPESVQEILPYHDAQARLTITADAIIDNRSELFGELNIDHAGLVSLPDSQLILRAYRKWGQDCPKHLIGDFAFAIWDINSQELFCAVDPTGTRAFYYYRSDCLFAFSTLIKSLFVVPGIVRKNNETWFADFLAVPSVIHQLDPELTPYKDIYLLPAGHTLSVRSDGATKQVYWQVERQPELKLKSDSAYEEAFREVLGEAVRCRMRSIRPVGVMMSGGLDSTTVACLAARKLAGSGRRLQAFSAVPMPGYRNWLSAGKLADESSYIEAVREHIENIDVTYCSSEGKHSLSGTDRHLSILEQPYKIIENLFWLDDIMATAQECNIGVVLFGGAGNATISWGNIHNYMFSLFRAGHWYRMYRECCAVARRHSRPVRTLYGLFRALLPYNLRRSTYRLKSRDWYKDLHNLSPINPDFARRTAVRERFRQFGYDPLFNNRLDSFEARQKLLSPDIFSHLGVIATKQSLAHRIALRDPTMDKRVIEFCLSLPESQYVRGGRDRFLIRRSMAGLLPDKVRLNDTVRGKQSADLAQRLQADWPELAVEIRNIGLLEAEREYLDIDKIKDGIAKLSALNDDATNDSSLRMLIRSLIFTRFLNMNK